MLKVSGLRVRFGDVVAVDALDLAVAQGELFVLLGASGSGKSTLLRAIGGFVRPEAGCITLDGIDLTTMPPHRRPVNTMFQSYALFPHMSVAANIGFGLRMRGLAKSAIAARVTEMLELVRLQGFGARRPAQLSGGQQQRVALARSLAPRPALLLLDEPLSALDRNLRRDTREELACLQRVLGIAFILVTHDQEEALTLATRIGVMRDGRLVQVGTPRQVYDEPADLFAARLTGPASVIDAPDGGGRVLVRPGWACLDGPLQGRVRAVWFRGPHSDHLVDTPLGKVLIREDGPPRHVAGACVGWTLARSWPLPPPAPHRGE